MKSFPLTIKNRFAVIFAGFLFLFFSLPAFSAEDGREIMTSVYNREEGKDRSSTMIMTLINNQGRERVRKIEAFSKYFGKDKKNVMIFREPADVKGTIYLSWEYDAQGKDDDKWLYLPAMKKERRISGATRNEYFMGSDFTYDDMVKRHPEKDRQTVLGTENYKGQECWKIECIPVVEETYVKRTILVGKKSLLILKSEYYDKDGLLKVFEADSFREKDGIWDVYKSTMRNVQRDHKTVMLMEDLRHNIGLKDDLFTVTALQRGRI
jgi:outer membrane lipoprotein-sorting protein